jgi:hypothetical protein
MRCNLIVQINEVTIRDYTLIEDEGIGNLVAGLYPELKMSYEDDEETPGRHMIVITGPDLKSILKFLDFSEIPVKIIA